MPKLTPARVRRIQKCSVDFGRGEILFFHNGGRVVVFPATSKRLKTLRGMRGYSENKAMGLHTAYVRLP